MCDAQLRVQVAWVTPASLLTALIALRRRLLALALPAP